jgi:hypothetical protein
MESREGWKLYIGTGGVMVGSRVMFDSLMMAF